MKHTLKLVIDVTICRQQELINVIVQDAAI